MKRLFIESEDLDENSIEFVIARAKLCLKGIIILVIASCIVVGFFTTKA